MPTNKPHFSIVMDEKLLSIVEDYQFENKIKSRGKAINALLRLGVAAVLEESKKAAPLDDSSKAASGKEPDTAETLTNALLRLGVIRPGEDITESDRLFLEAMFSAVKAHFQK